MCAFFILNGFECRTIISFPGLRFRSESYAFLAGSKEYFARRNNFGLEPEQFAPVWKLFYPGYFKMFAFSAIYRHK